MNPRQGPSQSNHLEISLQRQEFLRNECREKIWTQYRRCRSAQSNEKICLQLIEDEKLFCERMFHVDHFEMTDHT